MDIDITIYITYNSLRVSAFLSIVKCFTLLQPKFFKLSKLTFFCVRSLNCKFEVFDVVVLLLNFENEKVLSLNVAEYNSL